MPCLMKMGHTACWLSLTMGRGQASLGTPVTRTPTVAPGPKVLSGLVSRRSQGSSTEHRGPQKPTASVDAWWSIGRGRLRFPTLPRQLHDLTSPCDMQGKPSLPVIVGGARWPSPAVNEGGAEPPSPISSLLACSFLLAPLLTTMAPIRRFSAEEKGKAPRDDPGPLPPKKRSAHRRDEVAMQVVTRPWCERPPPGYPLPLYARAEGSGDRSDEQHRHAVSGVAAPW